MVLLDKIEVVLISMEFSRYFSSLVDHPADLIIFIVQYKFKLFNKAV